MRALLPYLKSHILHFMKFMIKQLFFVSFFHSSPDTLVIKPFLKISSKLLGSLLLMLSLHEKPIGQSISFVVQSSKKKKKFPRQIFVTCLNFYGFAQRKIRHAKLHIRHSKFKKKFPAFYFRHPYKYIAFCTKKFPSLKALHDQILLILNL